MSIIPGGVWDEDSCPQHEYLAKRDVFVAIGNRTGMMYGVKIGCGFRCLRCDHDLTMEESFGAARASIDKLAMGLWPKSGGPGR